MIFGAGFSGRAIGKKLSDTFAFVGGTTRSEDKFDMLRAHQISPFEFSGEAFSTELEMELKKKKRTSSSVYGSSRHSCGAVHG